MRLFRVTLLLLLTLSLAGSIFAANLDYIPGVLAVRFLDDLELKVNDNGIVSTSNPEIDRLMDRFNANDFEKFFGDMIIKNPEYSYLTRNDYKVYFPETTDMELVCDEFEQIKNVEWAYPDYLIPCTYLPNDPNINTQWWLEKVSAEEAWDIKRGDSEIIVAAIDSGTDWMHPDLIGNIWVNPGEDIDGDPSVHSADFPDMPGTLDDWNSVDDDGNGLVDDFIGWDWVTRSGNGLIEGEDGSPADNNPMDFHGHGTGCAAAMAEVGNNAMGAAGMAFNCTIMSMRAGFMAPDGLSYMEATATVACMAYAMEKGAKVINLSYGGTSTYTPMINAIDAGWESGMLIFGAAGNDNISDLHYPACYDNVICVGATNSNDEKADFSNFGDWVDICAPGVGCYTAWFDHSNTANPHNYTSWDGTSVATPIAAGIGALIVQRYPDLTNVEWREIVENTTDELDIEYALGSGRVNAYKAITQYYWPELDFVDVTLSDPDGNGHPDLGETIEVTVTVSNEEGWMDAENLNVSLDFDVDGIQFDPQTAQITTLLNNGEQADNSQNPLVFTIPQDFADGIFTKMTVTLSCEPNEYQKVYNKKILIGTPDLLIVDDDGGADYETFLIDDLREQPHIYYHVHDVSQLTGEIDEEYLTAYSTVFWMTGDEENPFSDGDIAAISSAMDNGVNFFIFGQTIDDQLAGTDFYRNYMHAEHVDINGNLLGLTAHANAPQPPILAASSIILQGNGGAGNNFNPDAINPIGGALPAYGYIAHEEIGGLVYDGDYKLIYFAFAFEAVSGQATSDSRAELLFGTRDNIGIIEWMDINGVEDNHNSKSVIPEEFAITDVYPNPFNSSTNIQISVPHKEQVKLVVYDILGREVANLADMQMEAGKHMFNWNAVNNSAGIYFVVMQANNQKQVRKMAYIK